MFKGLLTWCREILIPTQQRFLLLPWLKYIHRNITVTTKLLKHRLDNKKNTKNICLRLYSRWYFKKNISLAYNCIFFFFLYLILFNVLVDCHDYLKDLEFFFSNFRNPLKKKFENYPPLKCTNPLWPMWLIKKQTIEIDNDTSWISRH